MCIDAPESTTNSLSSGLRVDAGRHLFSEGEKNVALFFSFLFSNTFGQLPRCFAGPPLLPLCLLLRPILKFWSVGATLMRFTWANPSERRVSVSNVCVACKQLLRILHVGLAQVCLSSSVKNEDFGGSISWNTQPICRVFDELHTTGLSPDSWPLRSSHNLRFWLPNSSFRKFCSILLLTTGFNLW